MDTNLWTRRELAKVNDTLREKAPGEIVSWALSLGKRTIVTTNFRPYEGAILHAVTSVDRSVPVIWCDTGYNTSHTYQHAESLIKLLGLRIFLYVPRQTVAHRNVLMGIPGIEDPRHGRFTEQVKLEPFRRAMREHRPELWFTNLRKGQTALRDTLDIVSLSGDGIVKVSPFYHWEDARLDSYLAQAQIPNEHRYFDPTKVHEHRECGLHT